MTEDVFDGRWEHDARVYRVRFWGLKVGQTRTDPPLVYEVEEWDVVADDVTAVLDWARGSAGGRTDTVYAAVDRGPERGLVRVYGSDPTRPD
ncbi:MAG TPA: hypothetical protein VFK17_06320 [Gaiellaceae bacterium]|nr:hypothetical protein [Gaiellaceae bacterium]